MIALGIGLFMVYRIGKASVEIYRLLRDTDILRALPWSYIRRLPRRNAWVAIASLSLVVGTLGALGALVLPSPLNRYPGAAGLIAVSLGLFSALVRLLTQAWPVRRA